MSHKVSPSFTSLGSFESFGETCNIWDTTMPSSRPTQDLRLLSDITVDSNVVRQLPGFTKSAKTTIQGDSDWSWPLRVDVELQDGTSRPYFVKITAGDLGRSMLLGEFSSMNLLYSLAPDFVRSADLFESGTLTVPLHGRFGFHVTTHMGIVPQDNRWTETWEGFFIKSIRSILAFEERTQCPSDRLDYLARKLMGKVIPRLLRPLESEGRTIRPTLIHGDLQSRNARTDSTTGKPVIFDAGSFWGHNECDIGKWRLARFKMGQDFMDEYHRHMPKSEPQEDWEDRNILYSMLVETRSLTRHTHI
ncbi:hypothetical protein NM208_g8959 [Fusarium decemcellulare]|uniref:Uncharacterized protein n=1 Tax=Fusarium decemcellulare TaxID=57161 RepID=A0ACC1S3G0_9HYPO|nr:hypothetical protein NM208_g8959 [Fusarium decemcellulare]